MGKLIVFEGLDCSFKETNSKAYYEYLKDKGEKVELYSFPRYQEEHSVFVRDYLAGKYGKQEDMNYHAISLFYMMDMFDCSQKFIKPRLEEGFTIILDRYWYSNIYYRIGLYETKHKFLSYNKDKQAKEAIYYNINDLSLKLKLPKADIVIKLKADIDVVLDVVHKKNKQNDIHENDYDFLKSVHNAFDTIYLDTFVIDKSIDIYTTTIDKQIKSKEEIFNEILKELGHAK